MKTNNRTEYQRAYYQANKQRLDAMRRKPPKPRKEPSVTVNVRMTAEQKLLFKLKGGAKWLRAMIEGTYKDDDFKQGLKNDLSK